MVEDPIVEEVRRYRMEHASKHGNDIHRIFAALREEEKKYPERLVHFGPRKLSDRTRLCVAETPGKYKTNPENPGSK